MKNRIKNRKIDRKSTKQVVVDVGLHRLLKIKAARSRITIRELVEGCLAELLAIDNQNNEI